MPAREQKDTTTKQGMLADHEHVHKEASQLGDLDPARNEGLGNRCWQDTDTLSSSSPLSTPPASHREDDHTSEGLGDKATSLAASVKLSPHDSVPSRSSRSVAAEDDVQSAESDTAKLAIAY